MTEVSSGQRASGILLHITSLPSAFGIGDLGPESYKFADTLAKAGQHYWSILPLSPTRLEDGNSPYQTSSAFAGNPLLISPEILVENRLLSRESVTIASKPTNRIDYQSAYAQKDALLKKAFLNFKKSPELIGDLPSNFEDFCLEHQKWIDNYALYTALRQKSGKPWIAWPVTLRKREKKAILQKEKALKEEIEQEKFTQYVFFTQWQSLKNYCRTQKVSVIGDMPFYVAHDSADVWANPLLFSLTNTGKARFVGGVPPDYFSTTGQLWGNPVYDWNQLEKTGFEWWINRIRHNLTLYDKLRLDHFRGFVAYWQVGARAKTAKHGRWVKVPSAFLDKLKAVFPSLPLIAEDLGYIDEAVREAVNHLGIPGMRVLLFAFDGREDNPHLPKNHSRACVVYTGTHDTNTVKGWFTSEATEKEKQNVSKLVGRHVTDRTVSFELIKLALASVADLSFVPLQDVLSLGAEARMNNPGGTQNNWVWRALPAQITNELLAKISELTVKHDRAI